MEIAHLYTFSQGLQYVVRPRLQLVRTCQRYYNAKYCTNISCWMWLRDVSVDEPVIRKVILDRP